MGKRIAKVVSMSLEKLLIKDEEDKWRFSEMRIKFTFTDQTHGTVTIIEPGTKMTDKVMSSLLNLLPNNIEIPVDPKNPPYLLVENISEIEKEKGYEIFANENRVKIIRKISKREMLELAQKGLGNKS